MRYEIHFPITSSSGGGPTPPGSTDHFAPKYLVGNVPAGDTNVLQGPPFVYIPDPGDGSGIAFALTQPDGPGDVWIRPGTYNLNSGMVGPLVVPAGVRVYGSGDTTVVLGRTTGDQGVFVLNLRSQLRDLLVTVAASDEGSVNSVAVVRSIGAEQIENVVVSFVTDPGGVLRQGIRFEPAGVPAFTYDTALRNVDVKATTTTGVNDPTVCYWSESGQFGPAFVRGDNVRSIGGDVGVQAGGVWVVSVGLHAGFAQYGLWVPSGSNGSIRLDEGLVLPGPTAPNPVGILVESSGGHVIRSIAVQMQGAVGARGIVFDGGGGMGMIEVDDCQVSAEAEGIRLGSGSFAIDDTTVADSRIESNGFGIVIGSPGGEVPPSLRCHLKGNTVQVFQGNVVPLAGIQADGHSHEIEGNIISVFDDAVAAVGINVLSSLTNVRGNRVSFLGSDGIRISGERTTCVANVVDALQSQSPMVCIHTVLGGAGNAVRCVIGNNNCTNGNTYIVAPIIIDSSQTSCGDNTTFVISGAPGTTPGISLTGNNCTCVANVCEGSAGAPVANTGLGNEVAHNVGA